MSGLVEWICYFVLIIFMGEVFGPVSALITTIAAVILWGKDEVCRCERD